VIPRIQSPRVPSGARVMALFVLACLGCGCQVPNPDFSAREPDASIAEGGSGGGDAGSGGAGGGAGGAGGGAGSSAGGAGLATGGASQDAATPSDGLPARPDALPSGTPVILAVGDDSLRVVSFDLGRSWVVNNYVDGAGELDAFFGAAAGGGRLFALGWKAHTSTNAVDWQPLTLPARQWYGALTYGQGTFMMVGATARSPHPQMALTGWRPRHPSSLPLKV
jgi:hypothetical protein